MLGDELNPMVMTKQIGFAEVSDAREGSVHCAERAKRSDNKRMVGLRNVIGGEGEAGTYNGCKFKKTMLMQCA